MNTARKIVVSLLATSFLGATALPTFAQQGAAGGTPKMEQRMAHAGASKRGGKRAGQRHAMNRAFERYDTNQDGVITQDEVDAVMVERFAAIAGGGETIDLEQYRVAWTERSMRPRVRAFQRLDRDGDGNVTQSEYDRATDAMFERLDRDGDGQLTRPARSAAAGQSQEQGATTTRRGPARGHGRAADLMERFDADGDGAISRAEFDQGRAQSFGNADADGSGAITLEEFATFWQDANERRVVRGFQRLDSDGNLQIDQDEYSARTSDFVERHDRNDDGVVTKADRGGKQGKKGHRSMRKPGDGGGQAKKTQTDTTRPVQVPGTQNI